MYMHLGNACMVKTDSIIGIFDLDNCTISVKSREFLKKAEKEKRIVSITNDIPKSFIVCNENNKNIVYLSQLSSQTLLKRTGFINTL